MTLARTFVRTLLHHPLQAATAVIGVALGVAVVLAVDLANGSARRAFLLAAETVAGRSTHQVVGGPGGVPERLYADLRAGGIRDAAPVVEGSVASSSRPGLPLRLIGVDPFAEEPFRRFTPGASTGATLPRFLTLPGAVLALPETGRELGIAPGGEAVVTAGGRPGRVVLLGLVDPRGAAEREALAGVLIADVSTAQEILGVPGVLSRIDLRIPDGPGGAATESRVRGMLPPGLSLLPAGARASGLTRMTRAFTLNLSALSLLALVVGMFLVFNTMTFFVLRWRPLLGTLRALGTTRGEVFSLVLAGAAAIGAAGTVLGILVGTVLAKGLLALVARTISDLYVAVAVRDVALSPASFGKAVGLGMVASAGSVIVPALEAASVPPRLAMLRSGIERRVRSGAPLAAAAGLALSAGGALALALPGRGIVPAFAGLFALIAGYALVVPAGVLVLARLLGPLCGLLGGVSGRMAARNVSAALSRTGIAAAALVVAVSATAGIGIMIGSFRETLVAWLDQTLRADVYVTAPGPSRGAGRNVLAPDLIPRIAALPGVAAVSAARHHEVLSGDDPVGLFVVDIPEAGRAGFRLKEGDPSATWRALESSDAVLVSEPFAVLRGVSPGDRLRLRTDRGDREFAVAGVYFDYGSDRGVVGMTRAVFSRHWDDRSVDALGIYLDPGVDANGAARRIRRVAGDGRPAAVFSNRALRETSVAVFERTFAVTRVLRMLAVAVAFAGVFNALLALQLERSREIAVLRAAGMTPGQVLRLLLGETGLLGLSAGLLSIPLGIGQAVVLIRVIYPRSFGWTLQTVVDPALLVQAVLLAVTSSLLAGIYPAVRAAAAPPAEGLRND